MVIVHTLGIVLAFMALYYVTGRLLLDLLLKTTEPEERFPLSMGLGLVVLNTIAVLSIGLLGMTGPFFLTRGSMIVIAVLVIAILAVFRLFLRGRDFSEWLTRPTRNQVAIWGMTAFAVTFFLVWYDGDLLWEEACMVRAASAINVDTLKPDLLKILTNGKPFSAYQSDSLLGRQPGLNEFLSFNQANRLGPGILLAPFIALFETLGFRLVYALQGLLLPGLGFLIGRSVLGRARWGWLVAVLLTFNPYALVTRTFDENYMALGIGSLVLVLLLRSRPAAFAAGTAMALFLGIRHVMVLSLPFVVLFLRKIADRPARAVRAFLLGLLCFGFPYLFLHAAQSIEGGYPWIEPGHLQGPAPHSFFGLEFTLPVKLNFPFISEPMRSPYMAFPTLLAIPLDLIRRLGLLLAAFVPAGIAWLYRTNRTRCRLLVSWVWPLLLFLMVQSNWSEPNKMGVPATVLTPIALFVIAGMAFVVDSRIPAARRASWVLLGIVAPLVFTLTARSYEAPLDTRVWEQERTLFKIIFPDDLVLRSKETPEYVKWDRDSYLPSAIPHVCPDQWSPILIQRDMERFLDHLERPSFVEYERSVPDLLQLLVVGTGLTVGPLSIHHAVEAGGSPPRPPPFPRYEGDPGERLVEVVLNLGAPPLLSKEPMIRDTLDGAESLVLDGSESFIVSGFEVPWSENPQNLIAARDRFGTVYLLLISGRPRHVSRAHPIRPQRLDAASFPGLRVPLRIPADQVIRLIEVRSYRPPRWYSRFAVIRDSEVWFSEPQAISPT